MDDAHRQQARLDYCEGYSASGPDAYQPRHYIEAYDTSSQHQHQQQQQ